MAKQGHRFAVGVLLFLLSGSAFSQAHESTYSLLQIENHEYRDYSPTELRSLLGDEAVFLNHYRCDGFKENQLFTDPFQTNVLEDSLKLIDSNGTTFYYRKGVLYLDSQNVPEILLQDEFIRSAMQALRKIDSTPSGSKLLRHLEFSRHPVFIVQGGNRFDPRLPEERPSWRLLESQLLPFLNTLRKPDNAMPFGKVGAGGFVRWSPKLTYALEEADGVYRTFEPFISLAHELYHAYDSTRGVLDQRFVQGENFEFQAVTEYRGVFFENQIRLESQKRYRKKYSENSSGSMLDSKGQPIQIPSACL